jgi:chromosome segregation ATPase
MTIDERLERLTERHEALAESVESLRASVHEQHETTVEQGKNIDKLVGLMESFTNIVQSHERRLNGLEGGS